MRGDVVVPLVTPNPSANEDRQPSRDNHLGHLSQGGEDGPVPPPPPPDDLAAFARDLLAPYFSPPLILAQSRQARAWTQGTSPTAFTYAKLERGDWRRLLRTRWKMSRHGPVVPMWQVLSAALKLLEAHVDREFEQDAT